MPNVLEMPPFAKNSLLPNTEKKKKEKSKQYHHSEEFHTTEKEKKIKLKKNNIYKKISIKEKKSQISEFVLSTNNGLYYAEGIRI